MFSGGNIDRRACLHTEKLRVLETRLFKHILWSHPEFATTIGFSGYEDMAESYSLGEMDRQMAVNEGFMREIEEIDERKLDYNARIDLRILRYHIQTFIDGFAWRNWGYINQISYLEGPFKHSEWTSDMLDEGYEIYEKRIAYMHVQVKQQLELLKLAVDTGITHHNDSMSIKQNFVDEVNRILFLVLNLSLFSKEKSEKVKSRIKSSFNETIAALNETRKYIEKHYIPATRKHEGVSSLPGGLEFYHACLKYHLGLNLTAEHVHKIGLMEVKRIEKLMKKHMRRFGHRESLPKFFKHLRSIRYLYNNSQSEMVMKYNKSMQNINAKIWRLFKKIHLEDVRSIITMLPLTFHEANPGHHFQNSYANLQRLPGYRQNLLYGHRFAVPSTYPTYMAYIEGWALYAEHLGLELGLYKNQYDLFGKYCSEMFRACRLVVDTGIHAFGWTREKAVQYMAGLTDFTHSQLASEIDRYITWPGHACSYKIGEIKLLELRRRAERMLGKVFDIKKFHHQILRNGPVSLNILEELINEWIRLEREENNISNDYSTTEISIFDKVLLTEKTVSQDEEDMNTKLVKGPVQGTGNSACTFSFRTYSLCFVTVIVKFLYRYG
ncbi:hypothetical protein FSP39_010598 [Pinctada imbricata]|uniref:DUF885 domain-containing protein n=1 Tax=Pinctada imbricata TaxID=66713 RepID=A0AA88Y013_PINIB|nr:hypothetical protein FSP39_010598 [Pinctada imbricata]